MFCPNCGTDCKDANFCPECGTNLREWSAVESPSTVVAEKTANACLVDMNDYFERFNPNKMAAIKAIVKETGMDVRQAKDLVDREFAQRQKALYAAQPDAAMRDLKRTLSPKKAERDERKAELDKQGVVYCPKCLSTSVTGDKKGFGIGKAVVGVSLFSGLGLMAGNINAKKVRLTCMKCGYQWMAGKK